MTRPLTLPSREAWLEHRRIGGSDVAAILGRSKYRTEWDVFERLVHGRRDDGGNAATARGVALEPVVLRQYAQATGRRLQVPAPHTLWQREEWATASVDALADGRVVEVKTSRDRAAWGEPQTIERWTPDAEAVVRVDYALQCYHYLWVLDLEAADLAVLVPGDDPFVPELRVYTLLRDRELEAALVVRLRGWWQQHVVDRLPPTWDGSEAAGRHLATVARSGARPATAAEVGLAAAYATARTQADWWERERRRIGQLLVDSAGPYSRLDLPVGRVSVARSAGRSYLDERQLLGDHPELAPVLEPYRRAGDPYTYPTISGLERR